MHYIFIRFAVAIVTFAIGATFANLIPTHKQHTFHAAGICRGGAETEILTIESEYIQAFKNKDVELLNYVLADDFTGFGGRVNKQMRLNLASNPEFMVDSLETSNVEISVEGDKAWVKGQAKMSGRGRGRNFVTGTYHFQRQYEKRDGSWKIVNLEVSGF